MSPAYSKLKPTRSREFCGQMIHTAGLPVTVLARLTGMAEASANDAVHAMADFAENLHKWICVSDDVPARMGDGVPLDGAELTVEQVQELMLFAAGVDSSVPLA
jgi:hypothetical protein